MKNEKLYSVFGQLLVMAVLLLLACAIYWVWGGMASWARLVVDDRSALLLATLGIIALILVARAGVAIAILILLTTAGLDRLFLAAPDSVANTLLGGMCLLLAATMALGMMSERLEWVKARFPTFLMVVLGLVFLAPVAIIGQFLRLVRLLPSTSDE